MLAKSPPLPTTTALSSGAVLTLHMDFKGTSDRVAMLIWPALTYNSHNTQNIRVKNTRCWDSQVPPMHVAS